MNFFPECMPFPALQSAGVMLIVLAFALDALLGDPRFLPHPVVLMGRIINMLERALRGIARGAGQELLAGAILVLIIVAIVYLSARLLLFFVYNQAVLPGHAVALYLLYTTFSLRSLQQHVLDVEQPLLRGDLAAARRALSLLVGRDTEGLSAPEISRGALESLSENSGDGVVAPLFYAFIGGAPLALAYKAVSTMDSMLGYRNQSYLYFGRVAARLDDVANYLPSRLAALFLMAAALLAGKLPLSRLRQCGQMIWREAKNHPSPNSGYPEAAAAVLLGVRLGGGSAYGGILSPKPLINEKGKDPAPVHLRELRRLVRLAALLALLAGVLLVWVANRFLFFNPV
ncbi:MAG TPA: cobalamin biosynthesis protein CobD [Firmicutes bacterium]|nr:cobalamin biosynthesis protein CobD [Bacillota bacterium]